MIVILILLLIVSTIIWILKKRHNDRRREERRCTKERIIDGVTRRCGCTTHRRHLMIPADEDQIKKNFEHRWEPFMERFGSWFHPYTFDVCDDPICGHVKHVKGSLDHAKFFDSVETAWRRFKDPKQFDRDEGILVRLGVLKKKELSVSERMRRAAWESQKHSGREKARLDKLPDKYPIVSVQGATNVRDPSFPEWVMTSSQTTHPLHKFPDE